jgi:cation:H+ antiporter
MPLSDAASLPLGVNAALFAVAMLVVWGAGGRLTRRLDVIAVRTGMNHAFIGMLLLGGITSLPELANVLTASSTGNPALAINNLLGSAAINVMLLAVADAFIGRQAVTSIVAQPSTMMMATLCMLVLIAIAVAVTVGDFAVLGAGLGSTAICGLSVASFWLATGYDRRSPWSVRDEAEQEAE